MNLIKEMSLTHYTAIVVLEQLGLSDPSPKQIDIVEAMVLLASYPQDVTPNIIQECVGNDKLAYYFLYVKNNEWHNIKGNKEILLDFKKRMDTEVMA